jgi:hypothetical protein
VQVFLSHAFTDAELAHRVGAALQKAGFRVWDYNTDVMPGDNPGERLAEALRESEAMVVLLTADSVRSANITHEVGYALGNQNYRGRLIPVVAAPPSQLRREDIPWVLRGMPVVELSGSNGEEEGMSQLVQALRQVA